MNTPVPMKYVGFCDVLGFSSAVLSDFDAVVAVYQQFRSDIRNWYFASRAKVSVYSDSILIVGDNLPPVLHNIVALQWAALRKDWLIRGGVAYGRHWEESENENLFVVSEALVRAVAIEKSIFSDLIFESNVEGAMLSFAAASETTDTRPRVAANAVSS